MACRARGSKADFKLTEENHGTTFKNCTKGIEEELGGHFSFFYREAFQRISESGLLTSSTKLPESQ